MSFFMSFSRDRHISPEQLTKQPVPVYQFQVVVGMLDINSSTLANPRSDHKGNKKTLTDQCPYTGEGQARKQDIQITHIQPPSNPLPSAKSGKSRGV